VSLHHSLEWYGDTPTYYPAALSRAMSASRSTGSSKSAFSRSFRGPGGRESTEKHLNEKDMPLLEQAVEMSAWAAGRGDAQGHDLTARLWNQHARPSCIPSLEVLRNHIHEQRNRRSDGCPMPEYRDDFESALTPSLGLGIHTECQRLSPVPTRHPKPER
jgi:hypothetical protein